MKLFKSLALGAVAVLCCASPAALAQADPTINVVAPNKDQLSNYLEATTRHFVIVGAVSEAELRRRAIRLERFHAALAMIMPKQDNDNRLLIYLTDGIQPIQRMAHMTGIAGFYVPTSMGPFAVSPLDFSDRFLDWKPELVLFHEYTHHMQLQAMNSYSPGWVTEGMAELYATAKIRENGDIEIGAPSQARAVQMAMEFRSRWSAERLLNSDKVRNSKEERIEKYTRGGVLMHYLLMNKEQTPKFSEFVRLIGQGRDPVEAGRAAFGDLGKLDATLDAYVRRRSLPSVLLPAASLNAATEVTVRQLRIDEAEAMPLRLESMTDDEGKHAADMVPNARRLAARFPSSATAQQLLGQVEYEAGNYAEAGAALDRALAIEPDNFLALLYKGRVLGQKAIASKNPADWSPARALFVRANRLNPNHAWPFVLLYDSYLAAGRTAPEAVVTGLRRAVVLAPQDPGVRERMAIQFVREGDLAGAKSVIAPVAFNPEGDPDSPAAKFYPVLEAGGEKDALLAKAAEFKLPLNSFFRRKKDEEKPGDKPEGGKSGALLTR